ncbi:collagen alpha-1(XIV) chain isoform X1, partial [Clarias magur]
LMNTENSLVKTREEESVPYERTLVASEFIDWLLQEGEMGTREEAEQLGRRLLEHGIIQHVTNQHHFGDGDLLFQFRMNFRRRRRLMELLNERTRMIPESHDSPFCLRKQTMDSSSNSFLSVSPTKEIKVVSAVRRSSMSSSCGSSGYYSSSPTLSSSPPVLCNPKSVLKRQVSPEELQTPGGPFVKKTFTIVGDAVGWGFVVRGNKPCHVQAVDPSGPAAAAGMKVCQFVVSVNGLNVLNLDYRTVSNLILTGPRTVVMEVMEEVRKRLIGSLIRRNAGSQAENDRVVAANLTGTDAVSRTHKGAKNYCGFEKRDLRLLSDQIAAEIQSSNSVAGPRKLRFKVIGPDKLHVLWKEPKGEYDGYRFIYTSLPDGERNELRIGKGQAKAAINDFNPAKKYTVKVIAVSGSQQSRALEGSFAAQAQEFDRESTQPQRIKEMPTEDGIKLSEVDQFVCTTSAIADIVILVDGSWSIGRLNFRLVRTFLENLVNAFDVGINKTRIGLAQYSGDPRIEWHLNAFTTKDAVIDAVKNLPYKGGNTLTGLALKYILKNSFKPESGSRSNVPKIGILITDGKSQDAVEVPAQSLKDAGVEVFAIGVKNADENELKIISSQPHDTHTYNVADFSIMNTIVEGLTRTVCNGVKLQDKEIKKDSVPEDTPNSPQNLVTSEVTARSFRVSWTHAPGSVLKYRVVYYPSKGGQPEEVVVGGTETSAVLKDLSSLTEYEIAVFAVYTASASEALRGRETTLALPVVRGLELYDVTHSTMHARWRSTEGASGYMLVYAPISSENSDETEVKVADTVTDFRLVGLNPDTDYTVTVYAMFGDEASDPATLQETTLALKAPRNLRVTEVDHNSVRLSWDAPSSAVKGYRLEYVKSNGAETNEVETGPVSNVYLRNLSSQTEYAVSVFAVYDGDQSEPLKGVFTTKLVPAPRTIRIDEVTPNRFRVSWTQPGDGVELYKLAWKPFGGQDTKEVIVPGSMNTYVVNDLSPLTEYEVLLSAVYRDEAESSAVPALETTLPMPTTTAFPTTTPPVKRLGVTNLLVDDETTYSLQVSWDMDDADIEQYRVTYVSQKGDRAEESVMVPANRKTVMLQPLLSDTEYKITVHPVYPEGEVSVLSLSSVGHTLPLTAPSNLRVSEEWYNRFRLTWDTPASPTMGYRIIYQPTSVPGRALETFVGDDVNTLLILNLLSGTDYGVKVISSYTTGSSDPLTGTART